MSRLYRSTQKQQLYDKFQKIFKKEGDNCYDKLVEVIDKGYEEADIDAEIPRDFVIQILQDVTVDFYKSKIKFKSENQILNE